MLEPGDERPARRLRRRLHLGRGGDRMGRHERPPRRAARSSPAARAASARRSRRRSPRDGWPVGVNYRSDARGRRGGRRGDRRRRRPRDRRCRPTSPTRTPRTTLFEALEEELGPVLVLVNNAGVRADGLSPQIDDEDWDRVIDTNLSAAFRLTRRALRPMIRARFGRVVNIASIVGAERANPGQANYAASKAGLVGDDEDRGRRGRAPRRDRQRGRPGLDRDRHDRGPRRRAARAGARPAGPARPTRSPPACASWRRTAPAT